MSFDLLKQMTLSIVIFLVVATSFSIQFASAQQQPETIEKGDWVRFRLTDNETPALGKVVGVLQGGKNIIVSYVNPFNSRSSRISLATGKFERLSDAEARKLDKQGPPRKASTFSIGQNVKVYHLGKWWRGEVVEIPDDKYIQVKYMSTDAGEEIESLFVARSVKDINDSTSSPDFAVGDRVLVYEKVKREYQWLEGRVTKISGRFVFVELESMKTSADAEAKAYLSGSLSHVPKNVDNGTAVLPKYGLGDVVMFKYMGEQQQAKIIGFSDERSVANVQFFDTKTEKVKKRRVKVESITLVERAKPIKLPGDTRVWTSTNGKHTFEGILVEVGEDRIKIEDDQGKVIEVEISKLCKDDQKYILELR